MKITAKRILSVALAFAIVVTMVSGGLLNIASAETENQLKNSGFETFSEGNFSDWYLWKGNHGNTVAAQVEGRTEKAAKITVNDNSSIVNLSQAISPEAEGDYTLSIWIKIENIVRQWDSAPGVYLTLRNDNTVVAQSNAVNTNTDWQKLELTVDAATLAAGSKTFDLTIEYVKGDIYLDDAVFSKAEPIPADPDELLKNNGFESFSAAEFTDWYLWKGNHGNTTLEQVAGRTGKAGSNVPGCP